MNWKNFLLLSGVSVMLIAFFLFAQRKGMSRNDAEAKEIIQVRSIGHKLLLQARDSNSRILPVKQLASHEYELQFENPFSFQTDSVIATVHQLVKQYDLPGNYMVNVLNCAGDIVFGFMVSNSKSNTVVPCLGRRQPRDCYKIRINFYENENNKRVANWLIAAAALALAAGLLWSVRNRKSKTPDLTALQTPLPETNSIAIGRFRFYPDQHYLQLDDDKITLTVKEAELLKIFSARPNEVIDRVLLQKEVWENEGVIVTRSLDVFVSKLRKKLEADENVKIINIHGKGYRLEVV